MTSIDYLMFWIMGVAGFLIIRNSWVFNTRMRWWDFSNEDWRRNLMMNIKSYNEMMFEIWNWSRDINSWKKET